MTRLDHLPSRNRELNTIQAVIDTPCGSRAKYKYDGDIDGFRLSKLLPLGAYFPFNFGFIPSTCAEDGDSLDVLVLTDEPLILGVVAPVKLIGVLKAEQTEEGKSFRNDRLIGIVKTKYNLSDIHSLKDIDTHTLEEIEHFFISYNHAEKRVYRPIGRGNAEEAEILLSKGERRHEASSNHQ